MRMFLRPFAVHPGWVVDWYKQVRFGYDNNLGNNQPGFDPEFAGLSVEQKTLGDRLKEAGYVTGLIGKWHLGLGINFIRSIGVLMNFGDMWVEDIIISNQRKMVRDIWCP